MAAACHDCYRKCGKNSGGGGGGIDPSVLDKLEKGFAQLEASNSKSLLKKYLTRPLFEELKNKKTSFGSTLMDCIQSGILVQ